MVPLRVLDRADLPVDTTGLARFRIGKRLVRLLADGVAGGRIVETEAYGTLRLGRFMQVSAEMSSNEGPQQPILQKLSARPSRRCRCWGMGAKPASARHHDIQHRTLDRTIPEICATLY